MFTYPIITFLVSGELLVILHTGRLCLLSFFPDHSKRFISFIDFLKEPDFGFVGFP